MSSFTFSLTKTDGAARLGEIATPRGTIRTPAFMPVGTAATVKAMKPADVRTTGADIILGNTYHLMLRPGAERIAGCVGLWMEFVDGGTLGKFDVITTTKATVPGGVRSMRTSCVRSGSTLPNRSSARSL